MFNYPFTPSPYKWIPESCGDCSIELPSYVDHFSGSFYEFSFRFLDLAKVSKGELVGENGSGIFEEASREITFIHSEINSNIKLLKI